jgi:hypothetical protein
MLPLGLGLLMDHFLHQRATSHFGCEYSFALHPVRSTLLGDTLRSECPPVIASHRNRISHLVYRTHNIESRSGVRICGSCFIYSSNFTVLTYCTYCTNAHLHVTQTSLKRLDLAVWRSRASALDCYSTVLPGAVVWIAVYVDHID